MSPLIPSPLRVAHRYLRGGVLEAPPKMVEDITEWVLEAADNAEAHQKVVFARDNRDHFADRMRKDQREARFIIEALDEWGKDITSRKMYSRFYDEVGEYEERGVLPQWDSRKFVTLDHSGAKRLYTSIRKKIVPAVKEDLGFATTQLKKAESELQGWESKITGPMQSSKRFSVDLTGWRYEDLIKREAKKMDGFRDLNLPGHFYAEHMNSFLDQQGYITVEMSHGKGKSAASWKPSKWVLWVNTPSHHPVLSRELASDIRHELQHFAQSLMEGVLLKAEVEVLERMEEHRRPRPGMPSHRIMTPEFVQGVNQDDRLRQMGLSPSEIEVHALDDVEFYPRLADEIDAFKSTVRREDPGPHLQRMIKSWTGIDPIKQSERSRLLDTTYFSLDQYAPRSFFTTLEKAAPGKWRKAVGEFVKAVT